MSDASQFLVVTYEGFRPGNGGLDHHQRPAVDGHRGPSLAIGGSRTRMAPLWRDEAAVHARCAPQGRADRGGRDYLEKLSARNVSDRAVNLAAACTAAGNGHAPNPDGSQPGCVPGRTAAQHVGTIIDAHDKHKAGRRAPRDAGQGRGASPHDAEIRGRIGSQPSLEGDRDSRQGQAGQRAGPHAARHGQGRCRVIGLGLGLGLGLGGSGGSATFSPASIANLVWWNRANLGLSPGAVTTWPDQSWPGQLPYAGNPGQPWTGRERHRRSGTGLASVAFSGSQFLNGTASLPGARRPPHCSWCTRRANLATQSAASVRSDASYYSASVGHGGGQRARHHGSTRWSSTASIPRRSQRRHGRRGRFRRRRPPPRSFASMARPTR